MNVQIRFWNENLSEVQTHYLNSKLLKWQNAGWHVVWASWSKWCITPRINDHAFHGWAKYQLEILWSFKISMYWERVSPNYWCWFMWITFGARSLSDLHESQWLEIGKHFKGLKRSLPSDEHFRCFSIEVLPDMLGWGWTCCHPSNRSFGKCCKCHKAFSNLIMQIKTIEQKQFVGHLCHSPHCRVYESEITILCWCYQHDVFVSVAIPDK